MVKPDYILDIEKTEGIFSVMEMGVFDKNLYNFFKDRKNSVVYSEINNKQGVLVWTEVIYKTAQSFYINISNNKNDIDKWSMTIYYKPEQLSELIVYTNQLLKQLK